MNKGKLQRTWETSVDIGLDLVNNHLDGLIGAGVTVLILSFVGTLWTAMSCGFSGASILIPILWGIPMELVVLILLTILVRKIYVYIRNKWEETERERS